ncbi:MAG: replication factor small subunit [Candidatus Diapherotrites archaeon]|nr:replication factor small subunit [Candidatus Diapherotrites archaeon]MDN5366995.1 replication factor small subunit [Candidatus Diapherotrites archaeon]
MDYELPWTEKYRPKTLDEMVGQEEVVARLKAYAEKKEMPNLLFAGPPGTGKTTAAMALAREIFGDTFEQNFLELNASDERGINVVRETIKEFARTLPFGGAKFKIIFLDEADALTADAQHALRRTMEKYAATSRFILSCNYSSKIIEPIQSRCAIFRFRPLSEEQIKGRLRYIAEKEGLEITEDGLNALVYVSEGDLRKAINLLQASAALSKKIDEKLVFQVASRARPQEIRKMMELALNGKFMEARDILYQIMIEYGMSGDDVIRQMHKEVFNLNVDDRTKVELIDLIGEYEFRIVEGANERIQIEALLAQFLRFSKGKE